MSFRSTGSLHTLDDATRVEYAAGSCIVKLHLSRVAMRRFITTERYAVAARDIARGKLGMPVFRNERTARNLDSNRYTKEFLLRGK